MDIADKIRKIEALISRATSEGERQAAEFAKQRLQEKLDTKPIEYTISLGSPWEKKLFVSLCNKYGLITYRYRRQKYTTTMVRSSKTFINEILWPEYLKYQKILNELTEEILTDLISKIHAVKEEEVVVSGELPSYQSVTVS